MVCLFTWYTFFCVKVLFFCRKKNQNRDYPSLSKMGRDSNATWVYQNAWLMFFCKTFWTNWNQKSKDKIFPSNLWVKARTLTKYSGELYKNSSNFHYSKSQFGALFQRINFAAGIIPNLTKLPLWLLEVMLFSGI